MTEDFTPAPLPLTLELADAPDHFLLGDGHAYAACSKAVTVAKHGARSPLIEVTGWSAVGRRGQRRRFQVPPFASLTTVGVMFGLNPDRAVQLPQLDWGWLGPPKAQLETPVALNELASWTKASSARELAIARVAQVRASYGKMLTDVAYRIENAALFDPEVALTRRFDEALALWASVNEATPQEEVVRRAGMVQVTFDTARANAETIGLAHLPKQAQNEARRAAKAARLAQSTPNQQEREAALDQVVRILTSLGLYYLPNPAELGRQLER